MKTHKIRSIFASLLAFPIFLLASCAYLTPTIVPPMTDKMGYAIPSIKIWKVDVTTTGLIRGSYALEVEKIKLWKYSVDSTLEATETARSGIMDLLTVAGLGGAALLPMAAKHMPKGASYIKKEEEE